MPMCPSFANWHKLRVCFVLFQATMVNLPHDITLIADGVEIPLPADSQGIILLNIDSYSGGVPLWSHGTKEIPLGSRQQGSNEFPPMSRPYDMRRSRSLGYVLLACLLDTTEISLEPLCIIC
jgi:hypothetical protein